MQIYLVGGAVRDKLLQRPSGDCDYVVVGSSPEEMIAAGYKPVGADFPVFLHPKTKEEYALARSEKKSGRGYHGFVFYAAPDVTLEDDLRRRDLTINAMAQTSDGKIIDPFGGQQDLQVKRLRHVSPAFAEDPVRILRTCRFAAQLPDFSIDDSTMQLMQTMTFNGEMRDLTVERIWMELQRGMAAARPSRMIQALESCGALTEILPEVAALRGTPERLDYHPEGDSFVHTMMVLDAAAELKLSAQECFAALLHDIGKAQTPTNILPSHHGHEVRSAALTKNLCARLKAPKSFADLAILSAAEHGNVHNAMELRHGTLLDLLQRLDCFRRPERALSVLRVCEADYAYWPDRRGTVYPQGAHLRAIMEKLQLLDIAAEAEIAAQKYPNAPDKIAERIRQVRVKAIRQFYQDSE